jgi:hypothetical protein
MRNTFAGKGKNGLTAAAETNSGRRFPPSEVTSLRGDGGCPSSPEVCAKSGKIELISVFRYCSIPAKISD